MIKRLTALLPIALLAFLPAAASVTITVDAGLLTDHNGNALADGSLVLLIDSHTGLFVTASANSFVGGDNLILATSSGVSGALALNSSQTNQTGETFNTLSFQYGVGATGSTGTVSSSFAAGDKIAIRWYDNFTYAQFAAGQKPTTGYYGTYTTLGSAAPDGGVGWVGPTDGQTISGLNGLNFFTLSDSGTQANIEGEALTPVVSGSVAVPEPSTYALLATGFLLFVGMTIRKKRLAVVTK